MSTSQSIMPKNNTRIINAWCSYDWANSVYNLVVTTAIFPIYYVNSTRAAFGGDTVNFLGMSIENSVLYTYAISFSFLMVVILSPILSGIADYSGRKKLFMQLFTYMGGIACLSLYFFHGDNIFYGICCAVFASMGYAGALVFYNSFLPEIVTADRMDAVSAKGFSLGYIGSVILLIINLVMISNYEFFGFSDAGQASRVAFLTVGLWWIGFAQIAFRTLKEQRPTHHHKANLLTHGFAELGKVLQILRNKIITIRYLSAFFFWSMGVQSVMLLAPLFGEKVVGMEGSEMILVVLILQILAVGGAYLFAKISQKYGNSSSLSIALVIWIGVCIGAFFLHTKTEFYLLAAALGVVMGGIQSAARATYAKLLPADTSDNASFFSFYDVTEKVAIVTGTFAYGIIEQLTGNMRNSTGAMSFFFLLGFILLFLAKLPKKEVSQ